jgi:hypothetical protein
MIRPHRHHSPRLILGAQFLMLIALVVASIFAASSDGSAGAGPSLTGGNVRVSTHDLFPNDPFFSPTGPQTSCSRTNPQSPYTRSIPT